MFSINSSCIPGQLIKTCFVTITNSRKLTYFCLFVYPVIINQTSPDPPRRITLPATHTHTHMHTHSHVRKHAQASALVHTPIHIHMHTQTQTYKQQSVYGLGLIYLLG